MGPKVGGSRLNVFAITSKLPIHTRSVLRSRNTHLQFKRNVPKTAITILLLFASVAMAASPKNVLFLHEGSRLLPYQMLMARELQKDLTSNTGPDIEIFEEYLDNWRLDHDIQRSANALEAKYSGKKFDMVLADGSGALQLLVDHPPTFFRARLLFLSAWRTLFCRRNFHLTSPR